MCCDGEDHSPWKSTDGEKAAFSMFPVVLHPNHRVNRWAYGNSLNHPNHIS